MQQWPLLITLSFIALLLVAYFVAPPFHHFIHEAVDVLTSNNQARIQHWVAQFKIAGPVVIILIMVARMFLLVVPNIFLMILAIVMYGPVWGAIISFIGMFASSSVGYLIGRYLGPVTINKMLSKSTQQRATHFIRHYGVPFIAITRISSLFNDSIGIIAGALRMRYHHYILATLAGITPLIVLLAIYGRNGQILKALIWITAISLVVLIAYIGMDKRKRSASGKL